MPLHNLLDRLLKFGPIALFIDAARLWIDKRASSKGAALALYMVLSLAPMLVLVLAVSGWALGEETVRAELLTQVRSFAGERSAEVIQMILASAQRSNSGVLAALISTALIIFSSTTAFAELRRSLDDLWGLDAPTQAGFRGTAYSRLMSFGVVLILSAFLLISIIADTIIAGLQHYWILLWDAESFALAARLISNAFSFGIFVMLFAVILKVLPSAPMRWRDVLPGALMTAVLFLLGKIGIALYLSRAAVVSSYGAAGSVVALILWIYFSALLFFYGAAFTRAYWERYGAGRTLAAAARTD